MRATSNASLGDWLTTSARQNPEGLLLLAAGAVLMLRRSKAIGQAASSAMQAASGTADPNYIKQSAQGAKEFVTEVAGQAAADMREYVESAKDATASAAMSAGQKAQAAARSATSGFQATAEKILREQPLAVVIAGAAIGVGVAAVLPGSALEKRTLAPVGEKMNEIGRAAGEQVTEAAGLATEKLKDVAAEKGLNAEGLKDAASQVLSAVGLAAGKQAGERDDATSTSRNQHGQL